MFERFTEKAIKVITESQKEALELSHDKLYPEHLLLGIVLQSSGIASKFLKAAGVKPDILKEHIKSVLKEKETNNIPEILPFSESVKKILTDSWDKSKILGTIYISPEHLFLSLTENNNILKILKSYNVDVDRIISTVIKVNEKKIQSNIHPEGILKNRTISPDRYYSIPSAFEETYIKNIMNQALFKLQHSSFEIMGTEQIVESILENQESDISKLLASQGINIDIFREKLSQKPSRNEEYINNQNIFTPRCYMALKSAFEIAKELGAASVLPEHLLLGILKEQGGIAYKIFEEMGINTKNLFETITKPIEKQKPATMTILKLAKEEARRLGHNVIGTELILLGILGEGFGVGARVLSKLEVTLKDARKEVENIIRYGNEYKETDMVFTPRAKRLLEAAWIKAKKYNSPVIESEHLLLGIINEKECVAMKVLEYLGVDALEIKQGILKEIDIKSTLK